VHGAAEQADEADEARARILQEVDKQGLSSLSRASQLIRGVRWTRWSGRAPDRAIAFLETRPVAASFAKSVGGQTNRLCRHGGRVPLWRGGSRPLGVNGPRART
jgi:hypothetical protein